MQLKDPLDAVCVTELGCNMDDCVLFRVSWACVSPSVVATYTV